MNSPIVLDLFSGCGGLSLGFKNAGYNIKYFVEYWKPAIETHKINFPECELLGTDITSIDNKTISNIKDIEVIIGGPPCQGFSMAGNRNADDARNQLYKHYLRFVKIISPKLVVIENVNGILSMKSPEGERIISHITNDLINLGYIVSYKKLKAVEYGIPQKRERIFIIGIKKELYPTPNNKIFHVAESLRNIPEHYNAHLFSTPTTETINKIRNLQQGQKFNKNYNLSRKRLYADRPSPTVTTVNLFIHPTEDRFLTPRELARLQSFPDTFTFYGKKTCITKQVGNAVPPKLAEVLAKKLLMEVIKNE